MNTSSPLVTVIVTTRNNTGTLEACLRSIQAQTYRDIELIVVDNNSSDDTKDIARRYTKAVFNKGPERSTQRNYAADKAKGTYLLIIDSDMELNPDVVEDCVQTMHANPSYGALIIPEESFGVGYWAQCKRLERSFYEGVDSIEAARFFDAKIYEKVGGYNEQMVGGEDWELSQRVRQVTTIGRCTARIRHNEGHLELYDALKKRYYYTKGFMQYFDNTQTNTGTNASPVRDVLNYYGLYLSHPGKLLKNPLYGFGMLFMKTGEFGTNGLAMVSTKLKQKKQT